MKIIRYLIAALSFLIISCNNGTDDKTSFTEIDASDEISERAYSFAELYEQSDTEYHLGGQDPVRAIQIDCSGLIIMCYKYALVDTKYQLLVSDMTANYMYTNASTHIDKADLKKGNLIFMGEADSNSVTHIALFEKIENGRIYFIDSTQKDTNGDGINDIDGMFYHKKKKRGVAKQKLEEYLAEEKHEVFIYRYSEIDAEIIRERAERYLGCEYNHSFYPDNGKFYCSQYIAEILPIFDIIPMKFGDGEKEVSDYWKKYYEELGVPVPVGKPGTNPGQLAKSEKLHYIGKLDY